MLLVAIAVISPGCASGPKIAPGKSAAEVTVKAEPKKGYHPPSDPASYAGGPADQLASPAVTTGGQFAMLDYNGLYGIVVWLEPVSGSTPTSTPQSLTLASPNQKTVDDASPRVASVGDRLIILNRSSKTDTFYLRFDDGSVADIGSIGAGKSGAYTLKRAGAQSVISDSLDRPIDRLFVTPSPLYKIAHCNSTVTFSDVNPGEYRLRSWHYRLPGSSTNLTLAPGKVAKSTVIIGVNALPKVP
ncbi:MAG TPA: hypothetical protein VGP94_11705 [Tepidisphaeraceae bacterium]|nr:hypothetical protein [Tepidisphaeraceae bacterium]